MSRSTTNPKRGYMVVSSGVRISDIKQYSGQFTKGKVFSKKSSAQKLQRRSGGRIIRWPPK